MTTYERWSLRAGWIGIVLAIVMPLAVNYFFNPVDQEIRSLGKLNVTEHYLFEDGVKAGYKIEIVNIGKKPVGDIYISAIGADERIQLPETKSEVLVVPLGPFEFIREGQRMDIKLEQILAQDDKLTVHISGLRVPKEVIPLDFRVDVGSATGGALRINHFRGVGASGEW